MTDYRIISADSHIVEPPDMYTARFNPKLRNRAPHMERRKTPAGREYDAWMLEGRQVGTLGAVMQAGQRFEDPSQIDFLGLWEDVRKGAYRSRCDAGRERGGRDLGFGIAAEPGAVLVPRAGQRAALRDLPLLQRLDRHF